MKSRSLGIATVVAVAAATVCSTVLTTSISAAHPIQNAGSFPPPPASLSTSGDYATDVLGDPWDFSEQGDVPPYMTLGTEASNAISWGANGYLNLDGRGGSVVKLVRNWGATLPWGHDGLLHPVDANTYTKLSLQAIFSTPRQVGVRYWNEAGQIGEAFLPINQGAHAGDGTYEINLAGAPLWSGKIVRLDLLLGFNPSGGSDTFTMNLDWVRLHRADTPTTPPPSAPTVQVTGPSDEGGADYATVAGNPWDFAAGDDMTATNHIINASFDGNAFNGVTHGNDSWVMLPLRAPLNTDRYHRFTADVCYGGGFSLEDSVGGGMNARVIWFDEGGQAWVDSQDIVIEPGCNRMTFDMVTDPAIAVNDESTAHKAGWRGVSIGAIRFDLNEDRGDRAFSLRDIRLADDAAFSSGTYPITFNSTTGGSADIFVTTDPNSWSGTKVGTIGVSPGANTFNWDGSGLPNGTYWVNVVVHNGNNVGSGKSTGPVRIERPVGAVASCYVPLNPARLLDTRTGQGGNNAALTTQKFTELMVAGYGGVPPTGATAAVLNVTVDKPSAQGYITAWPSGEDQPLVSNLNFVPGQTVPNLVTVKIGANGRVNLLNSQGNTNVVADVVGYYTAATGGCTGRFTAVTPGRVLDTRDGTGRGGAIGPVGPNQSIDVQVTNLKGVPASGVSGVALNVTADSPTAEGYLTVWPTGEGRPGASSHNFVPGLTVANLVLAKVGSGGRVSIFNSAGTTHVIADVIGYFSSSGGALIPVSPQRVADSRYGIGRGVTGALGPRSQADVDIGGVAPVPSNATAVIANVTSVDSSAPSFITVWPTGSAQPTASTVNPRPGLPVPNLAYLKLGTGGQLSVYNDSGVT
ncbi:MAG TPA: hypothetical protein VH761_16710, partial [Ilumatobacteraceae bacterium]